MIFEVVVEHALMAAFLWELREMAVLSHHYNLSELADLEERIHAHLDGLRIAGEPGWELATERLGTKEPGAFFTAAAGAVEARDLCGFASVLDAAEGEPGPMRGIAGALAWVSDADAFALVSPQRCVGQPPALQWLSLAACRAHRGEPGLLLEEALFIREEGAKPAMKAELRTLAFRTIGELGRVDLAGELKGGLASANADERFWSARSAALLGVAGAADVLWGVARETPGVLSEEAAGCAVRVSPPGVARRQIEALFALPGFERTCLFAIAALGDITLLPWVLGKMEVPELSRLSGEVLSQLTGASVEGALRGLPPPEFQAGPNDDPLDSNVEMDPDRQLPWPNVAGWKALIESSVRHLQSGRVLEGLPLDDATLERTLRNATQRRRAGAAFERASRSPARPLFDVTARADRQAAALGVGP